MSPKALHGTWREREFKRKSKRERERERKLKSGTECEKEKERKRERERNQINKSQVALVEPVQSKVIFRCLISNFVHFRISEHLKAVKVDGLEASAQRLVT